MTNEFVSGVWKLTGIQKMGCTVRNVSGCFVQILPASKVTPKRCRERADACDRLRCLATYLFRCAGRCGSSDHRNKDRAASRSLGSFVTMGASPIRTKADTYNLLKANTTTRYMKGIESIRR